MSGMFREAISFTGGDLSQWNVSNVRTSYHYKQTYIPAHLRTASIPEVRASTNITRMQE